MSLDHPWIDPPGPGALIAVAPGIRWLRMPLPFQLDHVNAWLLEDGPGLTVVDTGVGLPDTRALWERVFAGGLEGRPITRVLVTHFHPDHMGNAAWLTARWRAPLWCTQAEWLWAARVSRMRAAADFEPRAAWYRRHGMDETGLARLRRRGNHDTAITPGTGEAGAPPQARQSLSRPRARGRAGVRLPA